MALIICPECNKEVSDETKNCIHCGYPINRFRIQNYKINQGIYDLSFVIEDKSSKKDKIKKLQQLSEIGLKESMHIVDNIYREYDIVDDTRDIIEDYSYIPKCPTCNSTNIEKISLTKRAVDVALFGLSSSDIGKTMHCKNCGYKW